MSKPKRKRRFVVDHARWIIELRRVSGEGGYFCFTGPEGLMTAQEEVGIVQRFKSLEDAEACIKDLVK
jgi:hypothetical protein